jgi:Spy/CpxP family protein refolding chaperone
VKFWSQQIAVVATTKSSRGREMKTLLIVTSLSLIGAVAAFAQGPYAGMQTRSIKALSDQQASDLREGRGMGLALAAELNGYPGPSHLLELADKLDLTAEQRSRVREFFNAMKQEAVPIGNRLLEQEAKLDDQFADRTVNEESLKKSISEIALTQGELRATHLKYHLSARSLLSDEQLRK